MPFALITPNGMVAQIADAAFEVHPAFSWVDVSGISPAPAPGWLYAEDAFTAPPPPPAAATPPAPTLAELQAQLTELQAKITALAAST